MYGRTLLAQNSVMPTRVSSDGSPSYKPAGGTIDWTTVAAVGSDTNLTDGSLIRNGQKFLRYGQVLSKITGGSNTLTSTHTSGNFQLVVTTAQGVGTTANIAFNATAAAVATAIGLLANVGAANISGSGGPLGTGAVTLVPASILGTVSIALGTSTLAGGAFTIGASLTAATNTQGYFGPYDPAASDGRQLLNKGDCFVLDETLLQYNAGTAALTSANDHTGSLIDGGWIWIDRIIQSAAAAHTLALGPTLAEFSAAFPRFSYAKS